MSGDNTMSNIDWTAPIEAYHEDGRCFDTMVTGTSESGTYFIGNVCFSDCPYGFREDGKYALLEQCPEMLWQVRNKAQPKADIPEWVFGRVVDLHPECCWTPEEVRRWAKADGPPYGQIIYSFARYIMSKEDPPVDPDLIEARTLVCVCDHDKWPDDEWHLDQARLVKGGSQDSSWRVIMALEGIKRGRELERGEVK